MNSNDTNSDAFMPSDGGPEGYAHLDADLHLLGSALDALGVQERASAGQGGELEDRVLQASLPALGDVRALSTSLSELGAVERAGGPKTLEREVFLASREKLRELTGARVHVAPAGRTAADTGRRLRWRPVRVAAVLLLVVMGGVLGLALLQQNGRSHEMASRTPEQLSEQIRGEMDMLFAVLDDRASAGTDTQDASADGDSQLLIDWLSEGAAS